MIHGKPQYEALLDEALQWQVLWSSGEITHDEKLLFETWLNKDASHAKIWASMSNNLARFAAIPVALKRDVYQHTEQELNRRRLWLKTLGGFVVFAGTAYTAGNVPQGKIHLAQFKTGKGEFKTVALPDGGTLKLNTGSAVDLEYSPTSRNVILHSGEIQLTSSKDSSSNPISLQVILREGTVRAIGTIFTVKRHAHYGKGEVEVAVQEGVVEVSNSATSAQIAQGQTVIFTSTLIAAPKPLTRETVAWTKGLIIAERQTLCEFLDQVRRYRPGVLRCDPAIAHLELSGVFPVADTDYILQTVANTLSIQIRQVTPYWTIVEPRPEATESRKISNYLPTHLPD